MVSVLTLTCMYGLLAALVILICILLDASVLTAIGISIVVLIIQFLISPWITDLSMKWFYHADFNYAVPAYLDSFVKEICEKYNMKEPKIGFINDGAPNAFTYGRTKNDARIIITRGIVDLLNEDEVKGVVGHELGHAVHYDMLVMTVAQVVPLVLYGIYEVCRTATEHSSSSSSDSKNKSGASLALIGFIAYILYLICQLIILWLSRTREYYADEFSARETRNPNALASALVQIGFGLSTTGKSETENRHSVASPTTLGISDAKSSKAMAVCCISQNENDFRSSVQNAMKWDMWNVWAKYYELLSTHPLISKRLLALSEISPEYGQAPYITFNQQKPESYVDDFARELLLNALPWIILIITVIAGAISASAGGAIFGIGAVLTMLAGIYKYYYKHKPGYEETTVRDLLGIVKVSGITTIPCELNGEIIGRGNPGCIFNEDFVIKDSTGIVMLDYNQPLTIINKIFAIFKSSKYFGKTVKVQGWYKRSPVPYIEVKSFEVDGVVKKCWTYQFGYIWRIILLVIAVLFAIGMMFA